ncbi:uncharacterized protein LOC128554982 [Mercenaria mercenaria]|uniref:uncharacterized protein LOC128554982 n=1 Tax=Mercenaria mercenaria TaxID=6596 RepID=UPI00234F7155|nr:uncharacterized protein LOC128554982 [Mercenaria mercenaria]
MSVENLVENFMAASVQTDTAGDEHNDDTHLNQTDEFDEDDPQRDLATIKHKLQEGCGCKLCCFKGVTVGVVLDNILRMREMSKDNKELFVMGNLREKLGTDRCKEGERQRVRFEYNFQGKTVCQKAFCLIYDMGKSTVKRIQKHISTKGVGPRVHGLVGRRPSNAFSSDVIKDAVQYLINYAIEEGLPQSSPPRGRDESPPIYLPASKTKIMIHQEYMEACVQSGKVHVGKSTFKNVWNQCVPHIKIMNPRDDVCKTYKDFRDTISMARSEDNKLDATAS